MDIDKFNKEEEEQKEKERARREEEEKITAILFSQQNAINAAVILSALDIL